MELQTNFAYNSLNLLEKAMRNDTIVAKYSYLADGTKLSAVNADDCGFAYRGSFTYRADAGGDRVFESTPFGGGRIVGTVDDETEVRYFLTDHLGSVRVVATDQNNVLERTTTSRSENGGIPRRCLFRITATASTARKIRHSQACRSRTTVPVVTTNLTGGGSRRIPCSNTIVRMFSAGIIRSGWSISMEWRPVIRRV